MEGHGCRSGGCGAALAPRAPARQLPRSVLLCTYGSRGRWKEKYKGEKEAVLKMEFKKFVNAFVRIPAQVIKTGRKLVLRLLAWNPFQHVFFRALEVFEHPMRC